MSTIKDWIANVEISHTDWRVRWPVIILPFLLFALVLLLFRASQFGNQQTETSIQLQKLLQARDSTAYDAADSPKPPLSVERGMAALQMDSQTLQQWLEKGRSTQATAQLAATLAQLASEKQVDTLPAPDNAFWSDFTDGLAALQQSVEQGEIKTPEARELIDQIRNQLNVMRAASLTILVSSDDSNRMASDQSEATLSTKAKTAQMQTAETLNNEAHNDETQTEQLLAINTAVDNLLEHRDLITRLHNRAFFIASLSALFFGLLVWGLWRGARKRHRALEGKHRSEQDAIVRLLDEITPLAQGDLRVRATVGEASTGAVADAFNFAVDELRRLVQAVTESADLVNSSVNETRDTAYHLARASSVQAREVHRSSNHLNVMSDTMAQLSASAVESSRIADISVEHARAGNQAVQQNADGLLRIRDQAEMTSRLMQRLVETSGTINERVRDIQLVAKQTDLLALNATIRTSAQISNGASEDVSMLSDDIAHLSDTLGRAARDITNLSDIVQQDAIITLKSMAKTLYELDDGQRKAVQASDALTEIDRVSIKLNGLISDIAAKSLRQAGVVKQLSSNMAVINNITSDSARQLQESAKALEALQLITSELHDSVSDFKLPYDASGSTRTKIMRSNPHTSVSINSKLARRAVKHA